MNRGEYVEILINSAREYKKGAQESLIRNNHMNDIKDGELIEQRIIDAVIVDYINFVAATMCMDLGLYTKDLNEIKIN